MGAIFMLYTIASIVIVMIGFGTIVTTNNLIQQTFGAVIFCTGFIGFILGLCADYFKGIYEYLKIMDKSLSRQGNGDQMVDPNVKKQLGEVTLIRQEIVDLNDNFKKLFERVG